MRQHMNKIYESVAIALQAVWANKLRSFMTVLGNIVAVTSIVTVVSLIQGMNAMVSDAIITDVGADSFTVQRRGIVRSEEDEERTRNNPLLTLDEAGAIRKFSTNITSVVAQAGRGATVSYGPQELDSVNIQGVTSEFQCRARPDDEPD
jgi:putative ABC transport system permease protein